MLDKLKNRFGLPKRASSASEIAFLKDNLEQERAKSLRYRLAAETATNLIYEWDLGSRVEWIGQVDEILGYQPNEIPRTWEGYSSLFHAEDRERVLAAVEKQLKSEEPYCVESRVRRKDGSYLYWHDRGTIIRDAAGKPVKWLGAVSDITERKRTELALKSLAARQEAILSAVPNIIMEVDNNRIYTWANQEGIEFFGEDVIGKEAAIFFEGEQQTYPLVQPVFAGAEDVVYVESWQRRRDGQIRLLAWRCRTLKDELGNVKGALSTADDITERKQAEEKLVKSEIQLSNALQMAHAGHWIYDVDQDVFTFNDNFYRIFRTTAAEAGGYQMSSAEYARRFCHPDDAALVGSETRAAIASADPNYSRQIEHRFFYSDGEVGTITVRFFILKDAQGRTVKTYGVNQDITERKRTEEALHQAEENYRRSLEESPLGIRIVTPQGETVFANRAILDLYGFDNIEELRATPIQDRYTPESYAEFLVRKEKRMRGEGYPGEYCIDIVRKTGDVRSLLITRKAVLWDGRLQDQAIYRDITAQRIAETNIHETVTGLRKALGGIIQVLTAASEIRDPYTAGHQRRVSDLARSIAQELALSPERVEGIRVAGVIHDIGKLAIPAEILSKPTRLSKIEYNLIQSHAQIGHDILAGIEFAWPIAQIVLQHHERMDGSGYPQRLKGDEILFESRILAVSDVIEAMASHRPYRPALGLEAALDEIEAHKGSLYDPAVVEASLKLFRKKGYVMKD